MCLIFQNKVDRWYILNRKEDDHPEKVGHSWPTVSRISLSWRVCNFIHHMEINKYYKTMLFTHP
jgi:hypothetical protein